MPRSGNVPTLRLTLAAIHPEKSPQSIPLAAAFLAAAIARQLPQHIAVTILDLYIDQSPEESARMIRGTRPDLVGFSVYVWNRALACGTAARLKQEQPQLTVFCGGPEATADRAGMLGAAPWDFLIHGEGEPAIIGALDALLNGQDVAAAPGVATLREGKLQESPPASPAALADLPSPFLAGLIDAGRYSGMLWQISRGCSFGCEFCFDGGGSRTVRRFPLQRLEAELHWLVAQKVSQVFVLDSTFNSDRDRAVSILKLIRKIAPDIHFHFEIRSEFLDRRQAELFAAITCSLQIGLQSGTGSVLQGVGRGFDRHDFIARTNLLNETGVIFGFDLIYGLPGDSLAGFRESIDFALSLYPNHLDIFPLALLPGTKLAARAAKLALHHLPEPPYTLTDSPSFPPEELAAAARLANACDIFYSRGKAVSWFLPMATALGRKPAQLLFDFADYLESGKATATGERELNDDAIFKLQCGFAEKLLTAKKDRKLLLLLLDLIRYNYHHAAALLAVPPPLPTARQLAKMGPADHRLRLAPSARLATFNYDILEILELEGMELRQLTAALDRSGSRAVIYPKQGEIRTEQLHEAYYRLLLQLDGKRSAADSAAQLGIPLPDAAEFLMFALREGIVVLAD
jgi:radical SAM superfamily enzyme YgiQ (UPF0313 family)